MEKRTIVLYVMAVTFGISLISCQKQTSTPNTNAFTKQQTEQVQNSDAQDALADKIEEDIDNQVEELENDNYVVSQTKALLSNLSDTVIIAVDHPDTITFPKVISITYYNYQDSSINEPIKKNGTIYVTVSLSDPMHPRLVTRVFQFTNFTIITDSTTILLNGERVVVRQNDALTLFGLQYARIAVTDNIMSNLNYSVVTTGGIDTLGFTRSVSRVRTAISYFRNVNYQVNQPVNNLTNLRFRHVSSFDTLTYTGTVTGLNEKGDTYIKNITSVNNIFVYQGSLIIVSGTMTNITSAGDSYVIIFEQYPSQPLQTLVTVKNAITNVSISFNRRFGRIFRQWW